MSMPHPTAQDNIAYMESLRYAIEQQDEEERRNWMIVQK